MPTRLVAQSTIHPFSALTESEIRTSVRLVRALWPVSTDIQFKVITLSEPPKHDAMPYLEAEHRCLELPSLDRRAFINYYIRNTVGDLCCCIDAMV
jgi:primary-amine oxidase